MTSMDSFNFNAPQFIEPFKDDVDDGADDFFDAMDMEVPPLNKDGETNEVKEDSETLHNNEETKASTVGQNIELGCDEKMTQKKPRQSAAKIFLPPLRRSPRFTSLAERVLQFHHATPPRFKRPPGTFNPRTKKTLMPTIAHSPLLQTKLRARQSTVPQAFIEQKNAGSSSRKSVKAAPAKSKPTLPPKPAARPTTVPKPFNLSAGNKTKKEAEKSSDADKASSTCLFRPKRVNRKKTYLAIEDGKLVTKERWGVTGMKAPDRPNCTTKPVPFSFEERERERLRAKEMKQKEKENNPPTASSAATLRPSSAKKKRLMTPSTAEEKDVPTAEGSA